MKAVIFDLFETLITEWGHEKYTKSKMAQDLGVDPEIFSQEWEKLHRPMYLGEIKDFKEAVMCVLNRINTTVEDGVIDYMCEKRLATKAICFENIDGRILSMLDQIKQKGYQLGLISNCSADEVAAFDGCSLKPYFDTIILSYEVGLRKPELEIYRLCTDRLKVAPEECIFIGDGGSNELDGASMASMKAIQATWFTKCYAYQYENQKGYEMLAEPEQLIGYLS